MRSFISSPLQYRPAVESVDTTIWVVNSASLDVRSCERLLDVQERARAAGYFADTDRRAFVATRACLRYVLGSMMGIEPSTLQFGVGAWGKPFIAAPINQTLIDFSVAHSGAIGLVAVARKRRIGVDLEYFRAVEDWINIATNTFGVQLAHKLANLEREQRSKTFLRCWTIGEAFAKATGLGLAGLGGTLPVGSVSGDFAEIRITGGPPPRAGWQWSIATLDVHDSHIASMIIETDCVSEMLLPRLVPFEPPSWLH